MSTDASLRRLERAHRANPSDEATRDRYVGALLRAGDVPTACAALSIRWEADAAKLENLWWRKQRLTSESLRALVADDLRAFDPLRLAASWSRRKDGAYRMNTTQFRRRYKAHEAGAEHRRLILIAWTPGTSSRPETR